MSTASVISKESGCLKPVNVFYIWYTELCRRLNMQPLNYVKPAKPKNETVLDFVGDRIKADEWTPIINALRLDTSLHVIAIRSRVQCKFLQEVDTEEKAKHMKRRAGSLYTAYIFKSLLRSLSTCIRRSDVLSALELDGLPLAIENIDRFLEALKCSKSIKVLTLKYCNLRDLGCQLLCHALRQMPNIEVLNLTGSGLGALSAQYIAKVVKYQQINRYCESWHNSLRYEDPEVGIMAGLRRITLNNNPNIGDEGLIYILNELDDDLWIKAIDMQRCGITENIATRLLDVIDYSRSIEVADFRNNEHLTTNTVEKVLEILKNKQEFGYESEFQWCHTATTLAPDQDAISTISSKVPHKSKSMPLGAARAASSVSSKPCLRRMQTCTAFLKKPPEKYITSKNNIMDAKKDVLALNNELQREMNKRKQSELENRRLKEELYKIKSVSTLTDTTSASKETITQRDKVVKFNRLPTHEIKIKPKTAKPKVAAFKAKIEPLKPKVEFIFESKNQVHDILQNLFNQNSNNESDTDDDFQLYNDIIQEEKGNDDDSVGSNSSLIEFMKSLKDTKEEKTPWMGGKSPAYFQKVLAH